MRSSILTPILLFLLLPSSIVAAPHQRRTINVPGDSAAASSSGAALGKTADEIAGPSGAAASDPVNMRPTAPPVKAEPDMNAPSASNAKAGPSSAVASAPGKLEFKAPPVQAETGKNALPSASKAKVSPSIVVASTPVKMGPKAPSIRAETGGRLAAEYDAAISDYIEKATVAESEKHWEQEQKNLEAEANKFRTVQQNRNAKFEAKQREDFQKFMATDPKPSGHARDDFIEAQKKVAMRHTIRGIVEEELFLMSQRTQSRSNEVRREWLEEAVKRRVTSYFRRGGRKRKSPPGTAGASSSSVPPAKKPS